MPFVLNVAVVVLLLLPTHAHAHTQTHTHTHTHAHTHTRTHTHTHSLTTHSLTHSLTLDWKCSAVGYPWHPGQCRPAMRSGFDTGNIEPGGDAQAGGEQCEPCLRRLSARRHCVNLGESRSLQWSGLTHTHTHTHSHTHAHAHAHTHTHTPAADSESVKPAISLLSLDEQSSSRP